MNGWWKLSTTGIDLRKLNEISLEHIADLIKKGFTEGEIIQDDEEDTKDPEDKFYWGPPV